MLSGRRVRRLRAQQQLPQREVDCANPELLAVELGSPEAVKHALMCSAAPCLATSRMISVLDQLEKPVGVCRVVHNAVPCDCLRYALAAYNDPTDSVSEYPNPSSNATSNLAAVYQSLAVRDLVGHVEVRAMPPPFDAGTREMLFCRPDSRHVYAHLEIPSKDVADSDAWATLLVATMQQALALGRYRPGRITVRDAVVARAMQSVGGMECPGTKIQVVETHTFIIDTFCTALRTCTVNNKRSLDSILRSIEVYNLL